MEEDDWTVLHYIHPDYKDAHHPHVHRGLKTDGRGTSQSTQASGYNQSESLWFVFIYYSSSLIISSYAAKLRRRKKKIYCCLPKAARYPSKLSWETMW